MIKNFILGLLGVTLAYASNPDPSNTFKFGDGTASNKNIVFNRNQGGLNPTIRWNEAGQELEFSNDGTNYSGVGSGSGSGGGINLITTNPNFENGVALGWSASGSQAFLPVTSGSNLLFGKGSATFQTFGNGQMNSSLYPIPVGLQGQSCMVSVYYKGGDNNLTLEVVDQSNVVQASLPFAASPGTTTLSIPFLCPTSGSLQLRVVSVVATSLIALDQMYLGQQTNLSQISQASFFGSMIKPNTNANCQVDFGVETSSYGAAIANPCVFVTTGAFSATAAPDLGWTANVPAGTYLVNMNFSLNYSAPGGNPSCRIEDDLGNQLAVSTFQQSNSPGNLIPFQGTNQAFTYTVGGNRTFQVQCRDLAVSNHLQMYGVSDFEIAFNMWRFPGPNQVIYNASTVAWNVDATYSGVGNIGNFGPGYPLGGGTLTTNPGSLSVQVPCSGTNPPQTGNCTSGTSQTGISFVVPVPGEIQVCVNQDIQIEASNQNGNVLNSIDWTANSSDSTVIQAGTVSNSIQAYVVSGFIASGQSSTVCQNFIIPQAGQVTFRENFQGSGSSDNNIGASFWTAKPINQQIPSPVLMNQVVTDNASVEKIERVIFGGPGSSTAPASCLTDPCTIYTASGNWLTSVNRVATGQFVLNVAAGVFSDVPVCSATFSADVSGVIEEYFCASTSPTAVTCYCRNSNAPHDCGMAVMCMGPH